MHFLPSPFTLPATSSAPFAFALVYRWPPHFAAEEDPAYVDRPFQFVLKLAQPQSAVADGASSAPYHVHELVLSAAVSVQQLESALLAHIPALAAVQLQVRGKAIPGNIAFQRLYGSQCALHNAAQPCWQPPHRRLAHCCSALLRASFGRVSASRLSLLLQPQGVGAPYSVSINGGLPLSSGVQTAFSRYRWLYVSAAVMGLCVLLMAGEDKPASPAASPDDANARQHWRRRMNDGTEALLDAVWPERSK